MNAADRLDDGRAHRRDVTGVATGGLTGAALGGAVGMLLPGLGNLAGALLGAVVGAGAGALMGRGLARQVTVSDFDPERGERPYVGARSPDADS